MRRLGQALGLLLGAVCCLAGCTARDIAPRPPKHPEEIVVPPVEEAKFSNPPNLPEPSNQNNDALAKNGRGGPGQPNLGAMNPGMGGMSGMGARGMSGMGGMGMGGMGGRGY